MHFHTWQNGPLGGDNIFQPVNKSGLINTYKEHIYLNIIYLFQLIVVTQMSDLTRYYLQLNMQNILVNGTVWPCV